MIIERLTTQFLHMPLTPDVYAALVLIPDTVATALRRRARKTLATSLHDLRKILSSDWNLIGNLHEVLCG